MLNCLIPPIVLASASPRRSALLAAAGIPHRVAPPHIPEVRRPGEPPGEYVRRLAVDKARAVAAGPSDIVLGADTTVVLDGHVLEKPADAADARRMLGMLSGRRHEVVTGVCLVRGPREIVDAEVTAVEFAAMSDREIDEYVASGEPMDKAGAYAIQGLASRFVRRVEGCYFNIVGLPVSLVWRRLAELSSAG